MTIVSDLEKAKDAALRRALTALVEAHAVADVVQLLSEVMDDHGMRIAIRSGDYEGAAELRLAAKYLSGYSKFISNYDGGEP